MVKRKLRKGVKNYVNIQIPDVFKQELGWKPGDDVNISREGKRIIVEKLEGVSA